MNNKKNNALKEKRDYDILNMLNSISNFEIFTPFEVTRSMVELLPEDIFKHPEYKFLDPCVKSGIFLREIVYKLDEHLPRIKYKDPDSNIEYDLSNKKERTTHILRNMIYGIAISELTAYVTRRTLYGVMEANADKIDEYLESKITVIEFEKKTKKKDKKQKAEDRKIEDLDFNEYYNHDIFNTEDRTGFESEGNIFYPIDETTIETEDTHYPFINKTKHKLINEIKERKMKFDVIIGNPPYQETTGASGGQAKPIYNLFIENAKELNPKFLSMIIPARWYSGGMGLNSFRENMLNDYRISNIVDFYDSKDCFPNVEIKGGVCYFLWDSKKTTKECSVTNIEKLDKNTQKRKLNDYKTFIRQNKSISIIEKIKAKSNCFLDENVYPISPFGLPTNFKEFSEDTNDVTLYANKKVKNIKLDKIKKNNEIIDKYKVLISEAYGAGETIPHQIIGKPFVVDKNSACTATYLVCEAFDTRKEAENFEKFLKSKLVRFLIGLKKQTQHTNSSSFEFVPNLVMNKAWTDELLYKYFNLTQEEIEYIESRIKPIA